jgi:hypothetical protein
VRDLLPPTLSQQGDDAEGSLSREVPGAGGSSLDKAGTRQSLPWCGSGERDGRDEEEYGQEPASTSVKGLPAPNLDDMGRVRCVTLPAVFALVAELLGFLPAWRPPGPHRQAARRHPAVEPNRGCR